MGCLPKNYFYSFLEDFSKPIGKDGKEHIDYVPTQIVTEYFRRIFTICDINTLEGIAYKSFRNGKKYVLIFKKNAFGELGNTSSLGELILTKVSHNSS